MEVIVTEQKLKDPKDAKVEAPSVTNLKPAEEAVKEPKVSKRQLSEEQYTKYCKVLEDGKPHKIADLLTLFGLDRTNSGRERLRAANRKINQSGIATVAGVFIDGAGKHFQMTKTGASA